MSRYQENLRPNKERSRAFLFDGQPKIKTALIMPSEQCEDVAQLIEMGLISPKQTHIVAVEREEEAHFKMRQTLKTMGFEEGENLTAHLSSLADVTSLPSHIDFAFIDFFGSISLDDARWISGTLVNSLSVTSRLCLTANVSPNRESSGNRWVDEAWRAVSENSPNYLAKAMEMFSAWDEKNHQKVLMWMLICLHRYSFCVSRPFEYNDTGAKMMSFWMSDFKNHKEAPHRMSHELLEPLMDVNKIRTFEKRDRNADRFEKLREKGKVELRKKLTVALKSKGLELSYLGGKIRVMDFSGNSLDGKVRAYPTIYDACFEHNVGV